MKTKNKEKTHVLSAVFAGLLNGTLGTGGGIPLWFSAIKRTDRRSAFATGAFGVLILSFVTLLSSGQATAAVGAMHPASPLFAVLGGALGALLLGKIPLSVLKWIFAVLLIGSGVYVLWQTVPSLLYQHGGR